jgi:hypothetical protein
VFLLSYEYSKQSIRKGGFFPTEPGIVVLLFFAQDFSDKYKQVKKEKED